MVMYYASDAYYGMGMPLMATTHRRHPQHKRAGQGHTRRSLAGPVLAIVLVLALLAISFEAWYISRHPTDAFTFKSSKLNRRNLNKDHVFPVPHLQSLILVACHSVYTGLDFTHSNEASSWYLLDYQKVTGQEHSFLEHIKLGITQAAADPDSMLMFSGGKTRKDAGPRAEAMGYWMVAEANDWYGHSSVRGRAFTEERARDSFENLLFGLCRFYELTGHYPTSVIVVGYEFKKFRFTEEHRSAIHWPVGRFNYIGTPALTEGAKDGEAKTLEAFIKDPYGCFGELAEKRAARDPFANGGYTGEQCPGMSEILKHCGPELYEGQLPWVEQGAGGN